MRDIRRRRTITITAPISMVGAVMNLGAWLSGGGSGTPGNVASLVATSELRFPRFGTTTTSNVTFYCVNVASIPNDPPDDRYNSYRFEAGFQIGGTRYALATLEPMPPRSGNSSDPLYGDQTYEFVTLSASGSLSITLPIAEFGPQKSTGYSSFWEEGIDPAGTATYSVVIEGHTIISATLPAAFYNLIAPGAIARSNEGLYQTPSGVAYASHGTTAVASCPTSFSGDGTSNPSFSAVSDTYQTVSWGYAECTEIPHTAPSNSASFTVSPFDATPLTYGNTSYSWWTTPTTITAEAKATIMGQSGDAISLPNMEVHLPGPLSSSGLTLTGVPNSSDVSFGGGIMRGTAGSISIADDQYEGDINRQRFIYAWTISSDDNDRVQNPFRLQHPYSELACTITQAASTRIIQAPHSIGSFAYNSWYSKSFIAAGTLSVTGGYLRASVTSNSAWSIGWQLPDPGTNYAKIGYRYMRLRWRSNGKANVKLRFFQDATSQEITSGDDGEWVTSEIDLFAGGGRAGTQTTWNAEYDLVGGRKEIPFYLPAQGTGYNIEIDWLEGFRKNWSRVTCLGNMFEEVLTPTGSGRIPNGKIYPATIGETDGVPTCWNGITTSSSYSAVAPRINLIAQYVNRLLTTGWSAVAATETHDPESWLNGDQLPRAGLQCVDLLLDQDASGGANLYIQPRLMQIYAFPGCGDIVGGGSYGDTGTVTFVAPVGHRSKATLNTATAKLGTMPETLTVVDGSTQIASGMPDAAGHMIADPYVWDAATSTPNRDLTISLDPTTGISTVDTSAGVLSATSIAWRHTFNNITDFAAQSWFRFTVPYVGAAAGRQRVSNICHPGEGWFGRAQVNEDSNAITWVRTNGPYTSSASLLEPVTAVSAGAGEKVSGPTLALSAWQPGEQIILWYEMTSATGALNVYQRVSYDNGATWSTPTLAITNGQMPELGRGIHDDLGRVIGAAFVADSDGAHVGKIKAVEFTPGALASTLFTFQYWTGSALADMKVTDGGLALTQLEEGQERWILSTVIDGELNVSDWYSADNCRTWTRLV